jgi:hypothetical protein
VAEATLDKKAASAVRLSEHRRDLEELHLERSRESLHAFDEDDLIVCNPDKILRVEKTRVYKKYNEVAYMSCLKDPISQLSVAILPILPILSRLISERVNEYSFSLKTRDL